MHFIQYIVAVVQISPLSSGICSWCKSLCPLLNFIWRPSNVCLFYICSSLQKKKIIPKCFAKKKSGLVQDYDDNRKHKLTSIEKVNLCEWTQHINNISCFIYICFSMMVVNDVQSVTCSGWWALASGVTIQMMYRLLRAALVVKVQGKMAAWPLATCTLLWLTVTSSECTHTAGEHTHTHTCRVNHINRGICRVLNKVCPHLSIHPSICSIFHPLLGFGLIPSVDLFSLAF